VVRTPCLDRGSAARARRSLSFRSDCRIEIADRWQKHGAKNLPDGSTRSGRTSRMPGASRWWSQKLGVLL